MANVKYDTGHGASVTFGTTSHSFNWTSIAVGDHTREPVDITHLASTGFTKKMVGDIAEAGPSVIDFQFDMGSNLPVTSTATETITLTFPAVAGHTNAPTYAGTGMITNIKLPDLKTGELQMGQMTVVWDGGTGPTFTKSS